MKYINDKLLKVLGMSQQQFNEGVERGMSMLDIYFEEKDYGNTLGDQLTDWAVVPSMLWNMSFPTYNYSYLFGDTIIMGDGECEVCGGEYDEIECIGQTSLQFNVESKCSVCGDISSEWIDKDVSVLPYKYD